MSDNPDNSYAKAFISDDIVEKARAFVRENFEDNESWSMTIARAIQAERDRCVLIAAEYEMARGPSHGTDSEGFWRAEAAGSIADAIANGTRVDHSEESPW